MRYVLILGLLIAGSASAQAATLYRHDTSQRVFISPKVAQSFDAVPGWAEAPRPSIGYDDVFGHNDRWDSWGHLGSYYGPMVGGL
jgi:hypothetical protein